MGRRLRRGLRVTAWALLSVLLTALVAALALLLYLRTDRGRERALETALEEVRKGLAQGADVEVDALSGSLTRDLELSQVVVRDPEGAIAVRAARVRATYDLSALLRRQVVIEKLEIEGAEVFGRVMRDGRLNLQALIAPDEDDGRRPIDLVVRKLLVSGTVDLPAPAGGPLEGPLRARVSAAGRVERRDGQVSVWIDRLRLEGTRPEDLVADARGHVTFGPRGLALDGVTLQARLSGPALAEVAPRARLRGTWRIDAEVDGRLERLTASARVRPPRGLIELDGQLALGPRGPTWQGRLDASAIDPAAACAGAPPGVLEVRARARGVGGRGAVEVERLRAQVTGLRARGAGRIELGGDYDARGSLDLVASDLSRLRRLGLPGLGGRAEASLRLRRQDRTWHVDGDARGSRLTFGPLRVGALAARVRAVDLVGSARIEARDLEAPREAGRDAIRFERLSVQAVGSRDTLAFSAHGVGPGGALADLRARGAVLRDRGLRGVDLTVERLVIALRGERWHAARPGHLRYDARGLALELALASAPQRLTVVGTYDPATRAVFARVTGRDLDLSRLGKLALRELPASRIHVDAMARGPLARPVAQLHLQGRWDAAPALALAAGRIDASARYDRDRLIARGTIASGEQQVRARVDLPSPLSGARRLDAELWATNLDVRHLRRVLPEPVRDLEGTVDVYGRAGGTAREPVLTLEVASSRLALGPLDRNRLTAQLSYSARQAELTVEAGLGYGETREEARTASRTDGARPRPITTTRSVGTLRAELSAPVDLGRLGRDARARERLERTTPITATVALDGVVLERLPFGRLGVRLPVEAGVVDADLRLAGTLRDPRIVTEVAARDVTARGVSRLGLQSKLVYADGRATADLDLTLRGGQLVDARAEAALDLDQVLEGGRWQEGALRGQVVVPSYDLSRVPQLGGVLAGRVDVGGTLGQPELRGRLDGQRLRLGEVRLSRFEALGSFDGRGLVARVAADQLGEGRLRAAANIPAAATAPIAITLDATKLKLAAADVGPLRTLRGLLQAHLRVTGTRSAPSLEGRLQLGDGAIALRGDPRLYRDAVVELVASGDTITLEKLHLAVGGGTLTAHGRLRLAGLRPDEIVLTARAHELPIARGSVAAWIDADVELRGRREDGALRGVLTVSRGGARLPKLAQTRRLQSTQPLEDVVFVDEQALRKRAAREAAVRGESALRATVLARIPGPFRVRSPELMTDLHGELQLELVGPLVRITGAVQSDWGRVELLGRRYDIERVRVGFSGQPEPDPTLDVRLTRELANTTLIIEVRGTARQPELVLSNNPPVYDQSQLVGIIISGDPGTRRISDRTPGQKVVGALSSLLINRIKEQIAPELPIDVIKIDPGTEGYTGLGTTRLEVGKYLTDDVYLSYVHQFGMPIGLRRRNSNQAQLEYRFLRNFEIETMIGDAGVGSVDFFWSHRF